MVHGVTTGHLKRRPLECFVCAFKSENPLRACLDPTKFRVHTITCHSVDDRCFTSVISKGDSYEAVVRGCRSGCVGSAETTCCESNRCNNQAFAMPQPKQKSEIRNYPVPLASKANRIFPPSVMFFVTILLILQTVSKSTYYLTIQSLSTGPPKGRYDDATREGSLDPAVKPFRPIEQLPVGLCP
ncbi:hypothetical protein NE865_01778 [Phthorimaea operculella]|nr:hypothetical protein NE865_01778 [Phthorimaea operculella]